MIFGYTLPEIQKVVMSLIFLGVAIAGLFIAVDPGFTTALTVLAGAVFATIAVFLSKNVSFDDMTKAVMQLLGATISVVAFFIEVNPNTEQQIGAILLAVLSTYAVFKRENAPTPTADMARKPAL